jgi:ribosomal-protein-alanine N-acetyltransferase
MKKFNVSLRPATSDDLAQVAAIEKYSHPAPPWSESAFRAELEKKFANFWVLTDDETDSVVHGYIVFSLPGDQAHIQTFAVREESRRQGLAKKILRHVVDYSLRHEAKSVVLEVRKSNQSALTLYQSLGFVVTHTTKYPDGEEGYALILRLDQLRTEPDAETDFDDEEKDLTSGPKKNLN